MRPVEVVKNAIEYIDSHLDEDLDCSVIANLFHYSEFHFHRLFKHVVNINVMGFVRSRRLYVAAKELLTSNDTILNICLEKGFNNQQTFNRAFKQKYGMTPKEFRVKGKWIEEISTEKIISDYYYRLMQGGKKMLKPYIVKKDVLRFMGKCNRIEKSDDVGQGISSLFEQIDEIFSKIKTPIDEKFYGITVNFANGTENSFRSYWLCKEVESLWHNNEVGKWERLDNSMETLILPATRWVYIPVRYDDPFVKSLAPEECQDDPSQLTDYVYGWAHQWIKENGYTPQDYPFELEIYGLNDGYEGLEGGANITLAIPII